jgi:acetolactate synthase-1/3 small subunit
MELLLLTVRTEARSQIIELLGIFGGRIVDVSADAMTVALADTPGRIDDFEELMRAYGIVELQRTGRVALPKLDRSAPRLRSVSGKVS